jgi:hypothetical protein
VNRTDDDKLTWRISTFSGSGNDCVALADTGEGVAMRNSNHPDDGTIEVDRHALAVLLDEIKQQGDLER